MKTKHVMYETTGTCSKMIDVTADENNIIQQYSSWEVAMVICKVSAN